MRFRPRQHVRRQRDFREIREKGRRHDCGGFMLWYYRAAGAGAGAEVTSDKYQVTRDTAAGGAAADPSLATCHLPLATSAPPPAAAARLGVVASSSAVGGAVRRARAKRRLREIFRHNQRLVPPGCDILLVARRAINQLEYRVMEQRFIDACRRIFKPSSDSQ
jgi:ribonuclease P protein component